MQVAMVLRKLVTPEEKNPQLRKVFNEYLEQIAVQTSAQTPSRAHAKNNIGNALAICHGSRKHKHISITPSFDG